MSVADEETGPGAVPLTLFSEETKAILFCKSLPEMFSLRVLTTLYDVANINVGYYSELFNFISSSGFSMICLLL